MRIRLYKTLNNVIDHAQVQKLMIRGQQDTMSTVFEIEDDGIGMLAKLRAHFGLDSDIHALIELVKGKLTVAPKAYSSEGLFFASKMFDRFAIESGELSVSFTHDRCEVRNVAPRQGTLIQMEIAKMAVQVFNHFCDKEALTFYRTHFSISLAALEGNLVSHSQAKRVATHHR